MQEQHDDSLIHLPLRLAAEPYAKKAISSSCVSLGIVDGSRQRTTSPSTVELALLCDDGGIHAFCTNQLLSRNDLLERLQSAVPTAKVPTEWKTRGLLLLARLSSPSSHSDNNNKMQWHWYPNETEQATLIPPHHQISDFVQKHNIKVLHDSFCAQLVTMSIRSYYRQQILEPSVRGFLSVLEKQFSRANLYLFELLQNAVDDGATIVEFTTHNSPSALRVRHNGRSFTPLDVLGLSSVGLSTKSKGSKRTIGFMGVGFKAVYKRYARVCIDDGTYRFVYQEPPNNKLGYGWVMLPTWKDQPSSTNGEKKNWCHFSLEQPRGGAGSIRQDLSVLPRTAPPLLGRAALVKLPAITETRDQLKSSNDNQWILDWNGRRHVIQRQNITSYFSDRNSADGSEVMTVTISNGKNVDTHYWLFVTHCYKPSKSALETYRNHTKRSHEGLEEVCGFVPLVMSGNQTYDVPHTELTVGSSTARNRPSGWVHSVLPTAIRMPVPMNFQASWLLSVDRQQVQDLTDNAWNGEILQQFPHLLANVFRWAAAQKLCTSEHYQAICKLLPTGVRAKSEKAKPQERTLPTASPIVVDILGQEVSLQAFEQACWYECILPVGFTEKARPSTNAVKLDSNYVRLPALLTRYCEGSNSIWVPPSWFEYVDADFLYGWLGKRPLRTDLMGEDAAFHVAFSSPRVVRQLTPLPSRTHQLAAELGLGSGIPLQQEVVWGVVRIMAAIASAYDEYPTGGSAIENTVGAAKKKQNRTNAPATDNEVCALSGNCKPSLPASIREWPVFVTESGSLANLDQIVLPGTDFANLPTGLLSLLHTFVAEKVTRDSSTQRHGKKDKRHKRQAAGPPPLLRLHHLLVSTICAIDGYDSKVTPKGFENNLPGWHKIARSASSFLLRAREELPSQVVTVADAASNLLESYSNRRQLSTDEISSVLQLARYAFETGNHLLLKYVMVDIPDGSSTATRLVRATAAYIGKCIDESGPGAHLQNFAGSRLPYISSQYIAVVDMASAASKKAAIHLFSLAGVQAGMAISVSVSLNVDKNKTLLQKILPKLPDRKLPILRKNPTKSDILLPYGLGHVMTRKTYYLVDACLPEEWERLASTMSTDSAIGFISLLLSIPVEDATNVTQKTVVAAANCLAGKAEPVEGSLSPNEAVKLSKNTTAPLRQRLYFLPPGQAGASAADIDEARLLNQLQSIKWLPCSSPLQGKDSIVLRRPQEALLQADPSRPEMPVVELPPLILQSLKTSKLAQALTWGTQAPPPPVGELVGLAKQANLLLSREIGLVDKRAVGTLATRMFDVWNAVCRSHKRDGLSTGDKKALRILLTLPCVPVRHVLESGEGGNWIVPPTRCILMKADVTSRPRTEEDSLKRLTVASLVASDFMCDFSNPSHNPFFHQPEVSMAVVQLAGIPEPLGISEKVLVNVGGAFVRYCCAAEPGLSQRASPLRDSFSLCLHWWMKTCKELPCKEKDMKLYVRHGPGIGTTALPARWVAIKGGPVQVVLADNKTRNALLSPEMNIQVLGVLDHADHENDCEMANQLSAIDSKIVGALGILRLSDKRFVVKTKARGTPEVVDGASTRLQLVCALLRSLEIDRLKIHNSNYTAENNFLDQGYDPPLMIRHESLSREFQAPGMESPKVVPLYAMLGRAPKVTKKKCILVCGDPDDYSVELETIILDHCGIRSNLPMAQMKHYRAATRLLSLLEVDKFHKFVKRDFADFEATRFFENIRQRHELVDQLRAAETAMDRLALRELLIRGEELFDDDIDGGDSILQGTRDLLEKLEEIERQLVKERKREAEAEAKREESPTFEKKACVINRGESTVSHAADGCLADVGCRGIGRGVDNRPAWMAGQGTVDSLSRSPSPKEAMKSDTNVGSSQASPPIGRGRGVTNLPAWLTSSGGPTAATDKTLESSETNKETTQPLSSSNEPLLARGTAKSDELSSAMSHAHASIVPPLQEAPSGSFTVPLPRIDVVAAGRKRDVSNLPAWMTNQVSQDTIIERNGQNSQKTDATKRSLSPTVETDGIMTEEPSREAKKARLSKTIKIALTVELPISQEKDFMSWFHSNVERELDNRLGTMHLSTQDVCGDDELVG